MTASPGKSLSNQSLASDFDVQGRSHRSIWASAVTTAFIQSEHERLTRDGKNRINERDAQSQTFLALSKAIVDCMTDDVWPEFDHLQDAVKAENRETECNTGINVPSGEYQKPKIEPCQFAPQTSRTAISLKLIVRGCMAALGWSPRAMRRLISGPLDPSGGSAHRHEQSSTADQATLAVQHLARRYLDSFPGPDNVDGNTAWHVPFKMLASKEPAPAGNLQKYKAVLTYRLGLMAQATEYKNKLKLDFPDCEMMSVQEWQTKFQSRGKGEAHPEIDTTEDLFRYSYDRIFDSRVLPFPTRYQGDADLKPIRYLAAAFADSYNDQTRVKQAIEQLKHVRDQYVDYHTERVRNDKLVRDAARVAFSSMSKRL